MILQSMLNDLDTMGVIFKNIQDSPVQDNRMYKPVLSDVYAVFKSSNIKSVNNSGKFDETSELSS